MCLDYNFFFSLEISARYNITILKSSNTRKEMQMIHISNNVGNFPLLLFLLFLSLCSVWFKKFFKVKNILNHVSFLVLIFPSHLFQAVEYNQYAVDFSHQEMMQRAKMQLEMEVKGEVKVKSIAASELRETLKPLAVSVITFF